MDSAGSSSSSALGSPYQMDDPQRFAACTAPPSITVEAVANTLAVRTLLFEEAGAGRFTATGSPAKQIAEPVRII